MTLASASSLRSNADQRAIAMMTAFSTAGEDDAIEEEPCEAFFQIVDEMINAVRKAVSVEELREARMALAKTFMSMASISTSLLEHWANVYDMDKYVLLSDIAATVYGSGT